MLTAPIVNFLPAADSITMLEKGRIVRNQVSYDSVEPSTWGVLESDSDGSRPNAEDDAFAEKADKPFAKVIDEAAKVETDLSRQTGDMECYTIYLKSMGWEVLTITLTLIVIHAGLTKMPRLFYFSRT